MEHQGQRSTRTGIVHRAEGQEGAAAASSSSTSGGSAYQLDLSWSAESSGDPAAEFALALVSYFWASAGGVVTTTSGELLDDLDLDECVTVVRRGEASHITMRPWGFFPDDSWQLELLETPADDTAASSCRLNFVASSLDGTGTRWLQASFDHLSPLPALALPCSGSLVSISAVHGLVVLAARFGKLHLAELKRTEHSPEPVPVARWCFDEPSKDAIPIYSHEGGTRWLATSSAPSVAAKPACWVEVTEAASEAESQSPHPPDLAWRKTCADLLGDASIDAEKLADHLARLATCDSPIEVTSITQTPELTALTPQQDGVVCTVVPDAAKVWIGLDLGQDTEFLTDALLHAYGHVLLGHVRPGDKHGVWDAADTITAKRPLRRWDREVRSRFAKWFEPTAERMVESLDDCTPLEKAQLGLWRMMGDMLGESRRLHKLAGRYQKAAYQRQAAQRMVAMLEDFGGAMLCDGVGLGKTYVATTLMVHYANTWKEKHSDNPEAVRTDPFRITVLSPNSVVSMWRREAIPPLAGFGVPVSTVRVISHTKLSRMTRASEMLQPGPRGALSDVEHLLLSDLVIVDEAHNFRSVAARRTKVLRDLLRLQPRRETRRRVALLTATPINNSLEDLRQEAGLLFSRPLWLSDARTDDGYRRQAVTSVAERCKKARSKKGPRGDVAPLIVHGQADGAFSDAIEFRDETLFGPTVGRIGDYLKEQQKKLEAMQSEIRTAAQAGKAQETTDDAVRIAEDLLDRIVVQRSRAMCKAIERQQGSDVELLFRPDQGLPEKLSYSDEYDGIEDVLARFIPLFDTPRSHRASTADTRPLSLKVYMWYDVREGIKSVDETSSVVGLQRVLVLKRLESSPVSFLITLLRLAVLHAHRLQQLLNICLTVNDRERASILQAELKQILDQQPVGALKKIRTLSTGDRAKDPSVDFIKTLSKAYVSAKPAADTDDPPPQLSLFSAPTDDTIKLEQLDRLWALREVLLEDLSTLFEVTPDLADIIFGSFDQAEWPRRFIAGGEDVDWPQSATWGLRLVTDAKLRCLVSRLLLARRQSQKVIVFTQFSDTIAYIQSVLRACTAFGRNEWQMVLRRGLDVEDLQQDEVINLLKTTATITGSTEDRDEAVNAFAPFYRIGPHRPVTARVGELEQKRLLDEWSASWRHAMEQPRNVVISTDVLAEGVNLQDVALLINFDVHWNPVRMIQRAGRIDRRLNPAIEQAASFPELEALAAKVGKPAPTYYFHEHASDAPLTINMILPDELEAELQLRERIATKTLAIDFTLGLEQGTGAEADWMQDYKYQGISSLNSLQKDRAIEQVAGYHEKLTRLLMSRGIESEWAEKLNSWFQATAADQGSPLVGRAQIGRRGGEMERFTRYLEPMIKDGVPYWFWTEKTPGESMYDGWLVLDGLAEHFPPSPERDPKVSANVSTPLKASHLLAAAIQLDQGVGLAVLPPKEIGRPLMQGASALAAPALGGADDRRMIAIRDFFILQLSHYDPAELHQDRAGLTQTGAVRRKGTSRTCKHCGHAPGMHKCCSRCKTSADDETQIEEVFGFRTMRDTAGEPYQLPQPWCRTCRSSALHTSAGT